MSRMSQSIHNVALPKKKPIAQANAISTRSPSQRSLFGSSTHGRSHLGNTNASAAPPEPLFQLAKDDSMTLNENWMENPFFKKIDQDRQEVNSEMGRKYNLNFNDKDGNIFNLSGEIIQHEKENGKRPNIEWEPICREQYRWKSFDTLQKSQSEVQNLAGSALTDTNKIMLPHKGVRLTSESNRLHEQSQMEFAPDLVRNQNLGKKFNDEFGFPNHQRFTDATGLTRDTLAGSSHEHQSHFDMNQVSGRGSRPDEQPFQSNDRLSSQFSEAIDSARHGHSDLMNNELSNVQTQQRGHHAHHPSLANAKESTITSSLFKPAVNLPNSRSLTMAKSNVALEQESTSPQQPPAPQEEVVPPPVRKNQKKLAGKATQHQVSPGLQLYTYPIDQISLNYRNKLVANPNAIEQALLFSQGQEIKQTFRNDDQEDTRTTKSSQMQLLTIPSESVPAQLGEQIKSVDGMKAGSSIQADYETATYGYHQRRTPICHSRVSEDSQNSQVQINRSAISPLRVQKISNFDQALVNPHQTGGLGLSAQPSEEYDGELTKRGIPTELPEAGRIQRTAVRANKLSPSATSRNLNVHNNGRHTPNIMQLAERRIVSPLQESLRRVTYRAGASPSCTDLSRTMPKGATSRRAQQPGSFLGTFRQNSMNKGQPYATNNPNSSNRLKEQQKELTNSMENLNINSEKNNGGFQAPQSKIKLQNKGGNKMFLDIPKVPANNSSKAKTFQNQSDVKQMLIPKSGSFDYQEQSVEKKEGGSFINTIKETFGLGLNDNKSNNIKDLNQVSDGLSKSHLQVLQTAKTSSVQQKDTNHQSNNTQSKK